MTEIFYIYFMMFIFYSFLGWLIEVIQGLIKNNQFVNRGFLIGPICPIYGCGGMSTIILLSKYKSDILTLFIMSIVIFTILEYLTSYFMEKIFKARWWDYSNRRFNLNGRVCLETMIPFGILGVFAMYVLNPFILKILYLINSKILIIISIILLIIFILDNIISYYIIFKYKVTLNNSSKDATIQINRKVKKILMSNTFYNRLASAFPDVKIMKK
jgi:uncharacterized membrane protein